jgi:hypothetical protein
MKSINDELHGPVEALLTLTTLCRNALDFVRDSLGPKSQGSIRNRVRLGCSATHLFTVNELQFPVEGALLEGGELQIRIVSVVLVGLLRRLPVKLLSH